MQVKLPHLGEGATSGTVSGLLVKVGETVSAGQALIELESEKAVASIPSPSAGTIAEILVKEGDEISVGQPIVVLKNGGDEPSSMTKDQKERVSVAPSGKLVQDNDVPPVRQEASVPPAPLPSGIPPPAAPSLRKLARSLGIDLHLVRGSERGGRIVLSDLRSYIASLRENARAGTASQSGPVQPPAAPAIDFSKWGPVERKKLSQIRAAISRKMLESWTQVPHVTQFDEADITDLQRKRKIHSPYYKKQNANLTLTPFILKALVDLLKEYPVFNASLDSSTNELVFKSYYHFGIAVDTEHGLLVPVLRDADKKSLLELSVELVDLAERARKRSVTLDEMQGGTFTISNQGGIGGGHFTPIINTPEVAILGIGRGSLKPVFRTTRVEKRLMLPLALSYDHRVIDGADAARFVTGLIERLAGFKESEIRLTDPSKKN
ncbi:MAG: 2-oxo acid dehydrogenase subunit E2 [Ignavibacteria bacterium]|nr:2-oxo acid dehydrogenase subunit E2 [Ignavibacteria bacterium]